jgi:hypothetical protein
MAKLKNLIIENEALMGASQILGQETVAVSKFNQFKHPRKDPE